MLTSLIVTLALLVTVSHCEDARDPKEALRLSERLNDVTGRIESIEKKVDKRLSEEVKVKARSLNHRVEELEEDHCDKDHYDCGGQDHECVSRLMVCDGRKDCRNGDDEKNCDSPIKAGDEFIGYKIYDTCGAVPPIGNKIVVRFHSVKHYPAFTNSYGLRAEVRAAFTDGKETSSYGWPTRGYYSHAKRAFILTPPLGESRGLKCTFDGSDWNQCQGKTATVGSLSVCAEYVFFRKGHVPEYLLEHKKHHDNDHHDDGHDHHH